MFDDLERSLEIFDLIPLTGISREVREWVDRTERGHKAQDQAIRTALKSMSIAVLETRSYIGQTSAGAKERNLDKEREISELWNEAHMDLQSVDPALASRCFDKAEYWADPSLWNAEKVRQYNITLDSMSDAVRGVLVRSRRH